LRVEYFVLIALVEDTCSLCEKAVAGSIHSPTEEKLTLFYCGHKFHSSCLDYSGVDNRESVESSEYMRNLRAVTLVYEGRLEGEGGGEEVMGSAGRGGCGICGE
jgi:hypothetical protein